MQLDWKRLFLTADGRIGRQDFWIGFAILFAANILLGWIPFIGFVIGLAALYCSICVGAKRLHDFGKNGWLMVAPTAVTLVCLAVAGIALAMSIMGGVAAGDSGAAVGAIAGGMAMVGIMGLAFLINVAFLLWVGLTPGQPDENQYGPPPVPAFNSQPAPPPAPPAL